MTTTPALPAAWAPLEAALRQRRPVRLSYHGRQRLICPHALGWKNGRPMLLGYQTGGHTSTGALPDDPRQRWRNFFVDEVDRIDTAAPANAWETADNYNHAHPFNAIDELTIAITSGGPTTRPLGNTRRHPGNPR
jgi:predicted DNA-binding transcriptional regulator YafY